MENVLFFRLIFGILTYLTFCRFFQKDLRRFFFLGNKLTSKSMLYPSIQGYVMLTSSCKCSSNHLDNFFPPDICFPLQLLISGFKFSHYQIIRVCDSTWYCLNHSQKLRETIWGATWVAYGGNLGSSLSWLGRWSWPTREVERGILWLPQTPTFRG